MKIDKPYNNCGGWIIRESMFVHSPGMMKTNNGFFPGMPTDFLQYKNRHPIDRRPEVLV